jgi:hypothetical protein
MIDLVAAPRTYLSTTWGTALYVDTASGELRHGIVGSGSANVLFVADPTVKQGPLRGWLMRETGEALDPVICLPEGSRATSGTIQSGVLLSPTCFELASPEPGVISLKSGNLYLCAEPNGRITLSRTECCSWEQFVPSDTQFPASLIGAQSRPNIIPTATVNSLALSDEGQSPLPKRRTTPPVPCPQINRRFARRRVLVIRHRGNLANKMVQYMGALSLANLIKDCEIVNVSIPEWRIEIPDDTQDQLFFDNVDLWSWDPFRPHLHELATMANRSESIRIMMADHLLRLEFLLDRSFYNRLLPAAEPSGLELTDSDLVINIRAGEILNGVAHYPILPIAFYEEVVAKTGLRPVFVGQLDPSEYVRQLKLRFPRAMFVASRSARIDFDLIRSAKNIIVAVSTFSWLAAWLSEAKTIILPLSGFYNPAHHREVDLLPIDDIRYRFFLFPLNYGLPERESLAHHERMKGHWKEVSRNQVALLRSSAPFLRVPRENYNNGLPARSAPGAQITFDPVWYAHEYVDAAMEISDGWFEDPLHHYLEVGRLRGYLPTRPIQDESSVDLTLPNLALNKRATQSSRSMWSRGSSLEDDAGNAVNGKPWEEYAFHTDKEQNPWWMVDLGTTAYIHFIRVFNRDHVPETIQRRASPMEIAVSSDGGQWRLLLRTEPGQIFGGYSQGRPLTWHAQESIEAKLVRISIVGREYFHLAEVEVYGTAIDGSREFPPSHVETGDKGV